MNLQMKGPATAATVDGPDNLSDQPHTDTPGSTHWQGLGYPADAELEWLFACGIPPDAMAEPWPIRSACVVFDNLHGFEFSPEGHTALIFKAEDRGEDKDLIAWEPSTAKLASWHGDTFCLGDLDQIENPATYFMGGALRVHADPLAWLKANREGIVILRADLTYAHLRSCQRVLCDDPPHAMRLEQWLQAPRSIVKILIAEKADNGELVHAY